MIEYIQMILMAVLQGITEFLPVSSSGHLTLLNEIFTRTGMGRLEEPVTLTILLHFASLLAILFYYWRPVLRMAMGNDMRLLKLLIVGTIPVGVVGVTVKLFFDEAFETLCTSVQLTGAMMLLTAVLLILAQKMSRRDPHEMQKNGLRRNLKTLSYLRAFLIGCVQALAILPGLSRSGSTITAGLGAGLKRQDAGTFSFLLALPAVGAASMVEILKLFKDGPGDSLNLLPLAVAFAVCFIVSLLSLSLLVKILRTRCIGYFAFYLIPVGLILLFL